MGNQRGRVGVRAASNSTIEIDFIFKSIKCRERLKIKPTPANLKRAENHRGAILDAIERGTFDYATTFPESVNKFQFAEYKGAGYKLSAWFEIWLQRQIKHLKSSTFEGYSKIVRNILIPEFGMKSLSELRRADVRDWCDKQTSSNKRLGNVQSVIRASLQAALDDELIEKNPLLDWTYSKQEAPKSIDHVEPFNADDQKLILDACTERQHRNLFQFAFWTGLRTSELVALEWGDIDWVDGTIRIERAKTQAAKQAETPKTARGVRDVKLLSPALEALNSQKAYSFLAGGVIFMNPYSNAPWEGDYAIRETAWKSILRRAGLRYRNPYQTRHTYASMMLTAGESPIWLAEQMGHSNTLMIFKVYARWIRKKSDDTGQKAVEMFGEKNLTQKINVSI
jgi:integrase